MDPASEKKLNKKKKKQEYIAAKQLASTIDNDFKLKIEKYIRSFMEDETKSILEFPATLSNAHRAYVHK